MSDYWPMTRQGGHSTIAGLAVAVLGRGRHWCDLRTAGVCAPISTGVVFLLPVLLVSSYWGLWLGLGTSVLAAAAFNFSTSSRPVHSTSKTGGTGSRSGCFSSPRR